MQCERAFNGHSLNELTFMNAARMVSRDRWLDDLYRTVDPLQDRRMDASSYLGNAVRSVSEIKCIAAFPNHMPDDITNPIKCIL